MLKRSYIRFISYIGFLLVVIITTAVISTTTLRDTKQELEVSYQQSLTELDECLKQVSTDITKSLYSNDSGEIYDLSRDLYAQCSTAKNAMSRLPVAQMELNSAYKFLSQCSDYANYIGNKIDNNQKISEKERETLKSLLKYCESFNEQTNMMVDNVASGAKITQNQVKSTKLISTSGLSNSFSQSAKTFEDFPTLIYDGPFSDQVLNKKSAMVKSADVLTEKECKSIVARALSTSENYVTLETDDKSKMPCYTFKSGRYTVMVTKQGGYIKEILYSAPITQKSITAENACNIATEYLKSIGYKNMEVNYYTTNDNVCTINTAYKQGKITVYPDLIKVSVSMSDGKIVGLDANTYLTNHINRKPTKTISFSKAKEKLSKHLMIEDYKLCIIPKESGKEVECYEFKCRSADNGDDVLVYINAENGKEEDILLMLKTDNGTMVK